MFKLMWHSAILTIPVTVSVLQAPVFSFAGVGLDSDLDQIATRYPHSTRTGQYLYIAPEDSHDHISGIEVSGAGSTRRVRISFETRREGQLRDYPACEQVQANLEQMFGPPNSIRRFTEGTSQRADRLWTSRAEALTLLCFAEAGTRLFAEAVQINRVAPGQQ